VIDCNQLAHFTKMEVIHHDRTATTDATPESPAAMDTSPESSAVIDAMPEFPVVMNVAHEAIKLVPM